MIQKEDIKTAILNVLPNAEIQVKNPRNDGLHFETIVIASEFKNTLLVNQHRIVMESLAQLFDDSLLHAMQLKTYTPTAWDLINECN